MENLVDQGQRWHLRVSKGWQVVLGCMLMQAIPFGVAANIQPQFISYVVAGEGFSLAAFSFLFTVSTLVAAVVSPAVGYIYSKVNARLMFLTGTLLCGLGFMLFAFAHRLWQFYLIGSVVQVGVAVISSIGVPLLINSWFAEHLRGKAMGIAFAGGSIGNIFLQTMVATSLARHGYGWSYFMYGALALAVGIPIALLALRFPRKNETIVGEGQQTDGKKIAQQEDWGYTLAEVRQEKYFWLCLAGFAFLGVYISALAIQYPAYLKGYLHLDATMVGLIGSSFALFALIGNVGGGMLFDRLGPVKGLLIAGVLAAAACVSLLLAASVPQAAFVFAVTKGLSVFSYMLGPAFLTGTLFGRKAFGAVLGLLNLGFAAGFASGSYLFGLIVDNSGYPLAWSLMLVCIVIGYAIVLTAATKLLAKRQTRINHPAKQ